ncbi:MAG: hypothetical protein R2758_10010 [Bacteroidales bacterium]
MQTDRHFPPIRVFTPDEYGADNQNWQITQGGDKFIYVANNRGLLNSTGLTGTCIHHQTIR